MNKNTERVLKEIERVSSEAGVFIILKDNNICGRITIRNIPKKGVTHVAFIIYSAFTNGDDIASYERVAGWGFNRQDFGIHHVLENLQEKLKNSLGIELTGNPMFTDRWIQDFNRAGLQVIQAL